MAAVLHNNTDFTTLNTGHKIPLVALGTWQSEGDDAYRAVKTALEGPHYHHIDGAAVYGNEDQVGQALKDSGVKREDVFVTTKLWNTDHKNAAKALDTSLQKLGLDYVDLYLIHWPVSIDPKTKKPYEDWDYLDTYKEMQKLVKSGKTKAIGVSNFTQPKLERLLNDKEVTIVPAVNQIELHPLLPQDELLGFMKRHNIAAEAYSPLGSTDSPLFKNEDLRTIASKNSANVGQVLVSWAVQRGTIVLPKSVHANRIKSNIKTFKLSQDDFKLVNDLHNKYGVTRFNDPIEGVFTD